MKEISPGELELLSAYIDGEMSQEEKEKFNDLLKIDKKLAYYHEKFQKISGMLQELEVEVPEPEQKFIEKFENKKTSTNAIKLFFKDYIYKWQFQTAVFLTGFFLGIFSMYLLNPTSKIIPSNQISKKTESESTVVNIYISPNQAEDLLKEVTATGLKDEITLQIKNNNWKEAAATYKTLLRDYSGTHAVKEMENSREINMLKNQFHINGGI